MPKVLKAYDSNYLISVTDGGTITLDTGVETGTVIVTGNLEVQGDTTTVNTTDLSIEDNIIVLSSGTIGPGLSTAPPINGKSGIEIDRGNAAPNARWIYDENVSWTLGGLSGSGTFYAEQGEGQQKLPINTPGIVAGGTLYVSTGNGVISVTGTNNYEEKVFNYDNGNIAPDSNGFLVIDDDHIPNAKGVKDFVDYTFESRSYAFISEGDTVVETVDETHTINDIVSIDILGNTVVIETAGQHGFKETDTVDISGLQANGDPLEDLNGTGIGIIEIISQFVLRLDVPIVDGDATSYVTGSGTITKTGFEESRVKIQVQGSNIGNFYNNRLDIASLSIVDNEITTTESNQDLILSSPGTGSVKVKDVFEITSLPYEDDMLPQPINPLEGIKLYTIDQGPGKTGLYYVNSNNVRDEIISKNRSLLFSMLF